MVFILFRSRRTLKPRRMQQSTLERAFIKIFNLPEPWDPEARAASNRALWREPFVAFTVFRSVVCWVLCVGAVCCVVACCVLCVVCCVVCCVVSCCVLRVVSCHVVLLCVMCCVLCWYMRDETGG